MKTAGILMKQAQNSTVQNSIRPFLLYPVDQPSSYYSVVFPQRDLRGKEQLLDLTEKGFVLLRAMPLQGLLMLLLLAEGNICWTKRISLYIAIVGVPSPCIHPAIV